MRTPHVFGWSFAIYRANVGINITSDVPVGLAERYEVALMAMQ